MLISDYRNIIKIPMIVSSGDTSLIPGLSFVGTRLATLVFLSAHDTLTLYI